MSFIVCLAALCFLMLAAYRGFSVILFAPIAALLAVLITEPSSVLPVYSGLFMDKMVIFVKLYFPVFLLGAVFGKVIELSGFSKSIVAATIRLVGTRTRGAGDRHRLRAADLRRRVAVRGGLRGLSLRGRGVPHRRSTKAADPRHHRAGRLHLYHGQPARHAADPEHHPGCLLQDQCLGRALARADRRLLHRRDRPRLSDLAHAAAPAGEGYGNGHTQEPEHIDDHLLPSPAIAILPLIMVGVMNLVFTYALPAAGTAPNYSVPLAGLPAPLTGPVAPNVAIWAVELALLSGIVTVFVVRVAHCRRSLSPKAASGGRRRAAGRDQHRVGVWLRLGDRRPARLHRHPRRADGAIPNPLINEAISVTTLAGITGSASGGMSIALAAMASQFIAAANAAHIPPEVLHRVAAMASGGMDTLPHNGAVITLLAVTGLTHRQSYKDIFAITCIKTSAVFVVIAVYYLTGIV